MITRIDENHRYVTSRDYERLFELAQKTPVICIVDFRWQDGDATRDIACTLFHVCHDDSNTYQIGARGISYVYAWEREDFVRHCAKYNVEWLEPTKGGIE